MTKNLAFFFGGAASMTLFSFVVLRIAVKIDPDYILRTDDLVKSTL